ncbi:hypothetical protein CEXT_397551, partial [Caerostris extrusa]
VSNNFGDATVLVIEATGVKIGCSICIGSEVLSDLSLSSGGQIKPVISGSVITETDAAVGLCAGRYRFTFSDTCTRRGGMLSNHFTSFE